MKNVEQKPERLHALDAVRGFALLLGIVLHATMSFIPAPTRIWIIQDSHPSMTLGILFFVIHVFRMTTFFLIAGFFAHLSFHRRGTWGFIGDRLQRRPPVRVRGVRDVARPGLLQIEPPDIVVGDAEG